VLRWFLVVLLLLTLGWKVAAQRGDAEGFDPYRDMAEFLARQRFTVAMAQKIEVGAPAMRASAGLCRILVAASGSDGSDRDRLRNNVTATDNVFVVFGGRVYAEQPIWLTTLDSLWTKFQREIGLKPKARPPFVVVATKSCDAERLPWNELG
jgi:hypothetical protein